MEVGPENHVISLYADDIILLLTNLDSSMPALSDLLVRYNVISGYKVNAQKSVAMPLNYSAENISRNNFSFQWNAQFITYLGLKIPCQLDSIFSLNHDSLFNKVEKDLDRWVHLPISLIGRVNCIKMNILPKFLYLFQTLPVSVHNNFFKKLQKLISSFIWKRKVPRIKIKTLYNTPRHGGLKLPNFKIYYWAAQSRALWVWQSELANPPAWKQIEQCHTSGVPLAGIPYIKSYHTLRNGTDNPIIRHTARIWSEIQTHIKSVIVLHRNNPFHANPVLPSALRDAITKKWYEQGIKIFEDLYENDTLMTFEQLSRTFHLPPSC